MRAIVAVCVLAGCTVDLPADLDSEPPPSKGDDGSGAGSGAGSGTGSGSGSGTPVSSNPTKDTLALCADCRIYVPPSYTRAQPLPLLIALHGDEGRDLGRASATQGVISMWSPAAAAESVIVFAPACVADIGCNGAWSDHLAGKGYRLDAATLAWLDAQVDAIEDAYNIDVSREMLAGWSGGAYWLGYFAQARADRYSGVAFVAGGMPAYTAFHPCPARDLPAYFLGGDMDFRTEQMSDTANAYASCGSAIETDLVANADHQATIASLGAGRAATVLRWLRARPL